MMRKLTVYIIGAALVSLSFMTTQAYAKESCAEGIKKLEDRNEILKGGMKSTIDSFIYEAKTALKEGKKKKCKKKVKIANKILDDKGM